MPSRLPVTLPAAGVEPAPAACAAVHHYTMLALSPAMLCYKTCYKQHICNATQTICKAFMQHCYRCHMQLTNATAIFPASEISRSGVGVSQQSPPRSTILRAASWRIGADSPRDSHGTTSASHTQIAKQQHGQFHGNTATLLQLHVTTRNT